MQERVKYPLIWPHLFMRGYIGSSVVLVDKVFGALFVSVCRNRWSTRSAVCLYTPKTDAGEDRENEKRPPPCSCTHLPTYLGTYLPT